MKPFDECSVEEKIERVIRMRANWLLLMEKFAQEQGITVEEAEAIFEQFGADAEDEFEPTEEDEKVRRLVEQRN